MLFEFSAAKLNSNFAPVALLASYTFQAHITWKIKKNHPDFIFNQSHFKQFIFSEIPNYPASFR